ncbi:Major Facilitator Superfamily protein [Theileria parva strain Muguga]|uniref:Major facilitator superfamily (MFS) profile domain-containing protein n=1 Tax=Theileria parva TaxID=5875 RepID=Q4N011_THEPA|nr:Major Facilitator Superfamily protein [Theileria parva strain Muguga]EAN31078.1 Major Facilitator Superfamily protein [Theileria parva strain Muguga]|eukprot:XP_763361.1 hypothetical protein [Theileria parva strain Muguga]
MTKNDVSSISVPTLNNIPDIKIIKVKPRCGYKVYTFIILTLIQIFVNYDNGVIPVSLSWIQEPYNFSSTELGIMGSLSYFAYVVMSPFMPYIYLAFSSQMVVTVAITIKTLSLIIYGLASNKYMFFFSRFCIGASQSLFITFYPIWVDTFAPKFYRNIWMSIIQSGIIIGMALGYVCTSGFSFFGSRGWRYSIFTQIAYGMILTILFYLIPKKFVNFDPSRDEHVDFDLCTCEKSSFDTMEVDSDKAVSSKSSIDDLSNGHDSVLKRYRSVDFIVSKVSSLGMTNKYISRIHSTFENSTNKPEYSKCSKCFINNVKLYQETINVKNLSIWSKFKLLIKHHVYILTCIFMSSITFCAMGMNFWMTKICVTYIKMNEMEVYFIFSIQPITAPLLGIITGSYLIDRVIYHYPEQPLLVDVVLMVWSVLLTISGLVVIFVQNAISLGICVFILLFFGASIIPTLTLQSVAYLPHRLKPAGSSFFISQYHIFGFTLGAIMPGIAMDLFDSYTAALIVMYLPGFILLACCIAIMYIKWRRIKKARLTGRSIYVKGVIVI